MILLGISLLLAGQGAAPTQATLVAGTVVTNGSMLVRLRWSMAEGWIPDGGFNLYKSIGGAAPVKLNAAPLKVDASGASHPMIQTAMQKVAVDGKQEFLSSKVLARVSSAPTFAAIRDAAATGLALHTGEKGIRASIVTHPSFKAYSSKLPKLQPKLATPNQVQQVGIARSQVIIGAMTVKGFAEKVGLGFDDSQVQSGAKVTYTLKAINGGVESGVLATLPFTVGADPQPPTPLVEAPIQSSAHALDLHFEIPANVTESAYGALWFQVTRFDSANPNGVSVSAVPIMPSYVNTTDGNETAALTSFVDTKAAYGAVKYTVQVEDAFWRLGPPVTVQTNFTDIAAPAPVPGAAAFNPGKRGAAPAPTITFIASAGDSTVKLPNAEPIRYTIERQSSPDKPNLKANVAAWTAVGSGPVTGTPVDPTTLKIRELENLSQKFRSLVGVTCVPKGLTHAKAQSALAKIEQSTATDVIAKFPALAGPVKSLVLLRTTDPSPALDTYCVYRVTPVMARNGVKGDSAQTSVLGVPAATAPQPPATIQFTDAIAPADVSTIKTSKTNAVRMQPSSGNFPPTAARATGDPIALGQQYLSAFRTKKKMDGAKLSLYSKVVPANYGRIVTLSWTPPAYTSAVRYRVYRGSGTGFTAGSAGTGAATSPAFNGANLAGHGVTSGFPKSKYSLNTPPSTKAYALLGTTNPGETSFVDVIQRSYSATYYYYVMPISRWGVNGPASNPVPVLVKESLPPTPPVVESIAPTSSTAITATIQPNLQVEDVVTYQLLRMAITPTASVTTADVTGTQGTATLKNAKLLAGTLPKIGHTTGVTMSLGGIPLASGAVGNGGARFGIVSHSAAGFAITAYRNSVHAALLGNKTVPTMPTDIAPFFKVASYTVVATASAVPSATAPISLVDTTAVPGEEYMYCVVAVDAAGLSSDPAGFIDAAINRPNADVPVISGAQFNAAADTVTFNISAGASGAAVFLIEREVVANDATSWVQVGTVPAPASGSVTFTDGHVRPGGNVYVYRVFAVDSRGRSSIASDAGGNTVGYATVTVTSS